LLLAVAEPPERFGFRLAWSTFRRRHQAGAKRCHARRRGRQQPAHPRSPTVQRLDAVDLELTDERWERISALLPPQKPEVGRPNTDHRKIVSGMLWVARTGSPWRDLPEQFGPWETVHGRFQRWRKAGIWQRILEIFTRPSADHAP
jgi:putative transposase of IS4/5 family DUF4096